MGETNNTSKPSGLLARIQAMQSENSQNSLTDFDKESFNYSEDTQDYSDDDFNLGDYTLNQETDSFTQNETPETNSPFDLNSSLPEAFVFGNNDFDSETDSPVTNFDTDLPDFDSNTELSDFETNTDLPDFDTETDSSDFNPDFSFDETPAESPVTDFNFDENQLETKTESPVTDFNLDDNSFETESPVTDFDFDENPLETSSESPVTDFDFDDTPEETPSADFDFDEPSPMAASAGLSFTGLYDKETILGDSSGQEEIKKKTKIPVIICIVCAIICLIATTLILFVIPSKYNILGKTTKIDESTVLIESTEYKPSDKSNIDDEYQKLSEQANVPPAKPNEIVVVEKAEDVIPVPPAINPKTTQNETYKIKWGDTLWDISNTYYKTPWKYKYIASYNKIANPDHIISGTTITIPAE